MHQSDYEKILSLYEKFKWLCFEKGTLEEIWQYCGSADEKYLLEHLISEFKYLDSNRLALSYRMMSNQVHDAWGLTNEGSYVLAVADPDDQADSSIGVLIDLKHYFAERATWSLDSDFIPYITKIFEKISDTNNIILVDNFIGTGDKISRKVKWLRKHLNDQGRDHIRIFILALGAMNISRSVLDALKNADVITDYFASTWHRQGISSFWSGAKRNKYISCIKNISSYLSVRHGGYRMKPLGYKDSEAIFAKSPRWCPNNTFSVFWWPKDKSGKVRKRFFVRAG